MLPSSWEARCFGLDFGVATKYTSTTEHTATVIICKMNPNVSESSVGTRTKMWVPETYQCIYRAEVDRDRDCEELEWSK